MNRREFLKTASCVAAASALAQSRSAKPNIIFILVDELGIGNVSCYGADNFKTPHIDRLALEGTRYTHCYSAPLCGPSCAAILTGRYAFRTGATSQDAVKLMTPSVETMMPAYLKPAGYVTAAVGKWGQLPLGPAEFGFDEHPEQDSLADFITRHRGEPFYVFYRLSNLQKPVLPTPDSKPDNTDLYTDNISYVDKLVGKLVAELDRLKLRDDTLIIFTSDHGTGGVYAEESTVGGRRLAGERGSMLEGGALVPLIVNWHGKTPAGKVSADLVDSTDFVPTLAELAGAKLPQEKTLDGHSFAPQVRGEKGQPRDWVFIEFGKDWFVREANWKLNRAGQLFDVKNAPFEEPLVPAGAENPAASAARQRLQTVLDKLNPAGGIMDQGDGSGRHAGRPVHTKKKRQNQ
jgi:arylsulfatase A